MSTHARFAADRDTEPAATAANPFDHGGAVARISKRRDEGGGTVLFFYPPTPIYRRPIGAHRVPPDCRGFVFVDIKRDLQRAVFKNNFIPTLGFSNYKIILRSLMISKIFVSLVVGPSIGTRGGGETRQQRQLASMNFNF